MRHAVALFVALSVLVACSAAVSAQEAVRNGEIVKIDAAEHSFVVKTARGETVILTADDTAIKEGEKTLKFEELQVGDRVKVTGVRKGSNVEAKEVLREPKTQG